MKITSKDTIKYIKIVDIKLIISTISSFFKNLWHSLKTGLNQYPILESSKLMSVHG